MQIRRADIKDVERAIAAIDRIEDRRGEDWHDYDFDLISTARSAMREWLSEVSATTREP